VTLFGQEWGVRVSPLSLLLHTHQESSVVGTFGEEVLGKKTIIWWPSLPLGADGCVDEG
jgi:hypothetical protein